MNFSLTSEINAHKSTTRVTAHKIHGLAGAQRTSLITNDFSTRDSTPRLIVRLTGREFIYTADRNYYVIGVTVAKANDGGRPGVGHESISNKSERPSRRLLLCAY